MELSPFLATGSLRPVISLPSLEPRSSAANPPPPSSTGSLQVPLGAVSEPSIVDEVVEEMDASCSLLHFTLCEVGVGHDSSTADPSTPPDLQSYDNILSVILKDLGKLERLIQDLPIPRSFWEFQSGGPGQIRGLGPEH